jgi:hypothetical protein
MPQCLIKPCSNVVKILTLIIYSHNLTNHLHFVLLVEFEIGKSTSFNRARMITEAYEMYRKQNGWSKEIFEKTGVHRKILMKGIANIKAGKPICGGKGGRPTQFTSCRRTTHCSARKRRYLIGDTPSLRNFYMIA